MLSQMTNLRRKRKRAVTLSVLLLAVIASGFSQIEFHAHAAADPGHVHDAQDHNDADDANPRDVYEPGNTGVLHAHDIGAPAIAPVPEIDVNVVALWQAEGRTPPPIAKPPDKLITPLHRPPIA